MLRPFRPKWFPQAGSTGSPEAGELGMVSVDNGEKATAERGADTWVSWPNILWMTAEFCG